MNKKTLIIGLAIVALIGLSVGYLLLTKESKKPAEQSATTDTTQPTATPTPSPTTSSVEQAGSYQPYTQSVFDNTAGTRLVFFHAQWCPQCRELEASIQSGSIPAGTTIFKVDYDTSQALRQKYGVTLQTTVVKVDANGNLAKKFVAYDSPTLSAVLQGLQ